MKVVLFLGLYVFVYIIHMENEYRHTQTTVSLVNYHFVFCPRYRRKIFNIDGVESRFKELTYDECNKYGIKVLALECQGDHVHIFVNVSPNQTIQKVIKQIKGATSHKLREEFAQLKQMPSLWTRSYFVSTAGAVSSEVIEKYVKSQKTRS